MHFALQNMVLGLFVFIKPDFESFFAERSCRSIKSVIGRNKVKVDSASILFPDQI